MTTDHSSQPVPPPLPEDFGKRRLTDSSRLSSSASMEEYSSGKMLPWLMISIALTLCSFLGAGWYYGEKTGYLYEYLPFMKKDWQAHLKEAETKQELALIVAVEEGGDRTPCNLEAIRKLLLPLKNVNFVKDDVTPLIVAINKNDAPAVNLLLQCKADPNLGTSKFLPLVLALESKNTEIVNILLKSGAIVSDIGDEGIPLIAKCIDLDYVDGLKALLDHDCDPNQRFFCSLKGERLKEKISPLFYLLSQRPKHLKELYSLLVGAGADTAVTYKIEKSNLAHKVPAEVGIDNKLVLDDSGTVTHNIITWGIRCGFDSELLMWLGSDVLKNKKIANYVIPESGGSSLLAAILFGKEDLTKLLIEHGADPNVCSNDGLAPIHVAFQNENIAMIQYLLEHGANPNICEKEGASVLWLVLSGDRFKGMREGEKLKLVDLLLNHKADINLRPHEKVSSFELSLFRKPSMFSISKSLIKAGANVNQKFELLDDYLLNTASKFKNIELVEFLIKEGADVNAIGSNGNTPLLEAFPSSQEDKNKALICMQKLIESGANKGDPAVIRGAEDSSFQEVKKLIILGWGKKVNEKANEPVEYPPLLGSLENGSLQGAKQAMESIRKASIGASDEEKQLFSRVVNFIRDLFAIRANSVKKKQQIANNKNQIIKLRIQASNWMQPSALTGATNPSLANSCSAKAESLSLQNEEIEKGMGNKWDEISSQVDELSESLSAGLRNKDAKILERVLKGSKNLGSN